MSRVVVWSGHEVCLLVGVASRAEPSEFADPEVRAVIAKAIATVEASADEDKIRMRIRG